MWWNLAAWKIFFFILCYLVLYRIKSSVLIEKGGLGFVKIFTVFAEFLGSSVCFSSGLIHSDLLVTLLGLQSILVGIAVKVLLFLHRIHPDSWKLTTSTYVLVVYYVGCVFLCGYHLQAIAADSGCVACASGVLTCVVPVVAAAEALKFPCGDRFLCVTVAVELPALALLYYYCRTLSFEILVEVPCMVALCLSVIDLVVSAFYIWTEKVLEERASLSL